MARQTMARADLWTAILIDWKNGRWKKRLTRAFDRVLRIHLAIVVLWLYYLVGEQLDGGFEVVFQVVVMTMSGFVALVGLWYMAAMIYLFVYKFAYRFFDRYAIAQHMHNLDVDRPPPPTMNEDQIIEGGTDVYMTDVLTLHDGHAPERHSSDEDGPSDRAEEEDRFLTEHGPDDADVYDSDTLPDAPSPVKDVSDPEPEPEPVKDENDGSELLPVEFDLVIDDD